ncbi:phage tail tip protein [Vibrio nigripulchritudo]|uniref:phage tail tip protein J-related protein n=1 Tax=Vibrio nigripulchritudo TaxID=28173 RepID=UPI0003B18C30|nr:hypothetical protein [Vibrio nigripulchritudo]CCN69794.1 exported hypothetical protein [Vibrio nigripulchritudo SFn118]
MPQAIPVIVAGAASMSTATAVALGITVVAAGVAYHSYQKAKNLSHQAPSASARKQMFRQAAAHKQIILGHPVTSGPMVFAAEHGEPNDKGEGEELHIVLHLAGHACHDVTDVWMNDERLALSTPAPGTDRTFKHNNGAGWVHIYLGNHTETPATLSHLPDWSSDMIGRGQCFAHIVMRSDPDKWPAGIPNVKCAVQGAKVLDPRTGQTQWTTNPALLMRWYRSEMKHGVPMEDTYISAANICDELVSIPSGQERRYSCNYAFSCDENPRSVTARIAACCAGHSLRVGGRHAFQVGAYYGPGVVELSEDDIIGDIKITSDIRVRDRINTVTATYQDPNDNWNEVDMPRVQHAGYLAKDDVEVVGDLDLTCCPSPFQAQRVAWIHLNTTRQGISVEFPCNLKGVQLLPGMVFKLNFPKNQWHGVEFQVNKWKLGHKNGVTLSCKQHLPDNYQWNGDTAVVPTRPGLPHKKDPLKVESPAHLAYQSLFDSNTAQALITWEHRSFGGVTYEVSFYQAGKLLRSDTTQEKFYRLTDGFSVGTYEVRVRARSAFSVSSFASLIFSTAAPQKPVGCNVNEANWSITLSPIPAGATNLDTAYEFAFGFANNTPETDFPSHIQGRGRVATISNLSPDTTYQFAVREISRWGESPWLVGTARTAKRSADVLDLIHGEVSQDMLNQGLKDRLNNVEQRGIDTDNLLTTANGSNEDLMAAFKAFEEQQKASEQHVGFAYAERNIKKHSSELTAHSEELAQLVVKVAENLAASREYTRTAVGYCVDASGNVTTHDDAVKCVAAGHTWREGPLAEFIRNLAVSMGDGSKASVDMLAQAFIDNDGNPIARGSMTTDVNGKISGFINSHDGRVSVLDFIADRFRVGMLDDQGNFSSALYLDTVSKLLTLKGNLILGDGFEVKSQADIQALDGLNGAGFYTLTLRNGTFPSDVLATGDFVYAYKRNPVLDDHLTYRNANGYTSSTKRFDGTRWVSPTMLIHGDLLATGSVSGDRFRANSEIASPLIKGGRALFGLGGTHNGYHTEITQDGQVKTSKLKATAGEIANVTIKNNCKIEGTLSVNQIVGDIYKAQTVKIPNHVTFGHASHQFAYINLGVASFTRTLTIPVIEYGSSRHTPWSGGDYISVRVNGHERWSNRHAAHNQKPVQYSGNASRPDSISIPGSSASSVVTVLLVKGSGTVNCSLYAQNLQFSWFKS